MKHFRKILIALGILIVCFAIYLITAYVNDRCTLEGHKTVICIPVYGQSLALGEEAVRITDFDSLKIKYDGRIVTECLDYGFGFIDDSVKKQRLKKFLRYRRRSFELSLYTMAEALACGTPVITFDTGGSPEMLDATGFSTSCIFSSIK